jgi:hypothetical protein
MGGARDAITGRPERVGIALSSGRRSAQTIAAAPTTNKNGTTIAQNSAAKTGVSAATTTATRQKDASSLRVDIIDFSLTLAMIHPTGSPYKPPSYAFKCGNNSLNAADDDDRINS